MGRVVFEFELPKEQQAVEAVVMGRESARVIAGFRAWSEAQQGELERKVRANPNDRETLGYLRGISDAKAKIEELMRGEPRPEGEGSDG